MYLSNPPPPSSNFYLSPLPLPPHLSIYLTPPLCGSPNLPAAHPPTPLFIQREPSIYCPPPFRLKILREPVYLSIYLSTRPPISHRLSIYLSNPPPHYLYSHNNFSDISINPNVRV